MGVKRMAVLLSALLLVTGCVRNVTQTGTTTEAPPASTPVATTAPAAPESNCKPGLYIASLHMIDGQTGWVVGIEDGLAVRRTQDGGQHWSDVTPPRDLLPSHMRGTGAAFLDGARGWVAVGDLPDGRGDHAGLLHLFRTADGGKTWAVTLLPVAQWEVSQARLLFTDAEHGKLLAASGPVLGTMYKAVYETTDGGRSWAPLSRNFGANDMTGVTANALPRTEYVTGFSFRNPAEGWVTDLYRTTREIPFYHTTDGGRTWQRQSLAYPADLQKAAYGSAYPPRFFGPSQQDGIMLVTFSAEPSMVVPFTTHDGGATWQSQQGVEGWQQDLDDTWFDFPDRTHGFLLLGDQLQVTQDGGQHWQSLPAAAIQGGAIQFDSPTSGWAVTADRRTLLRSTDGGRSWRPAGITSCLADGPSVLLQAQTGMVDNRHTLAPNEQLFLLHRPIDFTLQFPVDVDLRSVKIAVQGAGWQMQPPTLGPTTVGKKYSFVAEPAADASPDLTVTLTAARSDSDSPLVDRPVNFFIRTSTPGDLLTAPLLPYADKAMGIRLAYPQTLSQPERTAQPNVIQLSFPAGSISISKAEGQPGRSLADLAAENIAVNTQASSGRIVTDQQGETRLGGLPAAYVQRHFDSAAGRTDARLYFVQTQQSQYGVTCATRQGPPVVPWTDVAPVCDRILATLHFGP